MTLKQSAIRGIAWSLADKLVNQLGYLAVTVYLAKLIGPESFGLIGMLSIFILIAENVVNGGFTQALVQRSNKLTEEDSSTIFYVNFIWGCLMYAILYFSAPWIAQFYQQHELLNISRVLFVVVIVNSLAVVVRAKLTIRIDFKSQTIAGLFSTIISSTLAIYLAQLGYGYWALVWLIIAKAVIQSLVLWCFCLWLPKLVFSTESFKILFSFGSHLMLAGMVATIVNNLYVVLIGRYYNATQVGYFTQASNLSNYLMQFINSTFQGVTYPIMTSIKDDRKRLLNIYEQLISITMFFSLPLLVGFASIGQEFILLFLGDEWLPILPVLIALCIAKTITPISSINMNILNAIGRSDLFLKIDLFKLPITLSTLLFAIPYGIEALSWAVACTSGMAFCINAYYPGKLFGFGVKKQLSLMYKYLLSVIVMYFIVVNVDVSSSLYVSLVVKVIVGFFVYVSMIFIMRDLFFIKNIKFLFEKLK